MNCYIPYLNNHGPDTAHQEAVCQETVTILQGHMLVMHILNYQTLHCQHLKVTHAAGYITETHLRH